MSVLLLTLTELLQVIFRFMCPWIENYWL